MDLTALNDMNNRVASRHVAQEFMMIHFRTDPDILRKYLPEPFVLNHSGEALMWLADSHFNDEAIAARSPFVYPNLNYMREVVLVAPCKMEDMPGVYMTNVWQDRDWCYARGPVLGYNTELAEVHLTRFPGGMRTFYQPEPGKKVKGVLRLGGQELASAWMELEGEASGPPWPEFLKVFGRRKVEDLLDPEVPLINDVLLEYHDEETLGKFWRGTPHMRLGAFMKDWPVELIEGYFTSVAFSTAGSVILKDLSDGKK